MKAILEDILTGEVTTFDVGKPELQHVGIPVRTAFYTISSTAKGVNVAAEKKSLVGNALARPDLVKQVVDLAQAF